MRNYHAQAKGARSKASIVVFRSLFVGFSFTLFIGCTDESSDDAPVVDAGDSVDVGHSDFQGESQGVVQLSRRDRPVVDSHLKNIEELVRTSEWGKSSMPIMKGVTSLPIIRDGEAEEEIAEGSDEDDTGDETSHGGIAQGAEMDSGDGPSQETAVDAEDVPAQETTEDSEERGKIACEVDNGHLLFVVEERVADYLEDSIEQYLSDLLEEGVTGSIEIWAGGTVEELRLLIAQASQNVELEGALLVGDLPAAWYEQDSFGVFEEFPTDLYFMDFDAEWADVSENGVFDTHTELNLDVFVSRIVGSEEELQKYFEKVHHYRTHGLQLESTAYIYKDDDWEMFKQGEDFGLSVQYDELFMCETADCSTKSGYMEQLTQSGAAYVYQWIHAHPSALVIADTEESNVTIEEVETENLKGAFYNLFNCSASRFTEDNVAMSYLMKTDTGLATIGTTKAGGVFAPEEFHQALFSGSSWGAAFRTWYNEKGKNRDDWYLGTVILGDPFLTITEDASCGDSGNLAAQRYTPKTEWTDDEMRLLEETMGRFARSVKTENFEAYKRRHPTFFESVRSLR